MFKLSLNKNIHMNYGKLSWEDALKESHKTLLSTHPRSPAKLIPPHQWIKQTLKKQLSSEYELYAMGKDKSNKYNKEYKVSGKFYNKDVDITIVKNNEVKGAVSFKFVASNYSQNSNNYFENLVGECFNIQANNIPFCHVFVIRDKIPYYDNKHNVKKYEQLTEHNLDKYLKLNKFESEGSPSKISMSIIHITGDEYNGNIIHPSAFKKLDDSTQNRILDDISVSTSNYSEYPNNVANELKSMEIHKTLKEFIDLI